VRTEAERRFGDRVEIVYVDVHRTATRALHAAAITRIRDAGLDYPVTFLDGAPIYDGAVSYPAILRAVDAALSPPAGA
jgi:disulfide oxidoreductase YuzD